jgi:hypothetical protein
MTNGQETDYLRTWVDMVDWFSLTGLSVDPGLKLSAAYGAKALESVVDGPGDEATDCFLGERVPKNPTLFAGI